MNSIPNTVHNEISSSYSHVGVKFPFKFRETIHDLTLWFISPERDYGWGFYKQQNGGSF